MLQGRLAWTRMTVLAVALVVAALAGADVVRARVVHADEASPVPWDAAAGRELEQELLNLHHFWNTMDVPALQRVIIGDDRLVTFDLDPDTYAPIRLSSRAEMDAFTKRIFQQFKDTHTKTVAEHPAVSCRATQTLGICTEECKVQLFLPDGSRQVQHLRGTAIAVRQPGGWRWIQWHMSPAGPIETFPAA